MVNFYFFLGGGVGGKKGVQVGVVKKDRESNAENLS